MASVDELLQQLRYRKLQDWFEGMSVDDFTGFTRDELMYWVGKKNRMRLKLFLAEPIFDGMGVQTDACDRLDQDCAPKFINITECVVGRTLNLSKKLCSSRFADMVSGLGVKPITKLEGLLDGIDLDTIQHIDTLDVSDCALFKEDLPYVRHVCARLPSCETVNLATNRIDFSCDGARHAAVLRDMLNTMRVVVVACPVASCDGKEFLESLDEIQHTNLIWTPERFLGQREWTQYAMTVKTGLSLDDIIDYHRRYYAEANKGA